VTDSLNVDFPAAKLTFCQTLESMPSEKPCLIYGVNDRSRRIFQRAKTRFASDHIVGFVARDGDDLANVDQPVVAPEDVRPETHRIIITEGPLWLPHVSPLVAAGHRDLVVFNAVRANGDITRMSIICEEIKTVFLPNLKVLYSSFRDYFRETFSEFANRPPTHDGLSSFDDITSDRFADFRKFSFVRNPFDRLLSCYREKLLHDAHHFNQKLWNDPLQHLFDVDAISFKDFVEFVCLVPEAYTEPHLRMQHTTLFRPDGSPVADFIGRFEKIDQDIDRLSKFLGVPVDLPHKNRSNKKDEEYRDFFDVELRDKVARRYRDDLESFGYTFE